MGKKTKSKQRLDEYYHFAKTQGYRSRAAYKLIQLNRKYNFLNNATAVIDLCAAPGGWMQVCANTMPPNSTIIGVDLDDIKKVPGAMSFKGDITKPETYDRLRKELKGRKCDAVLNDGAPNVGANWSKDAYTQSELVLAAFKLATDFLKPGGHFITKIFRSTDTNSLMWVFKKFFDKVEMTKPKASRFASAETFVVGVGFNAPNFIDERYFDPKHVFKDTEADHFQEQMAGEITSIDKLLEKRRHRDGYADNMPMHMTKETTLTNFISSPNPLLTFAEFNVIKVTPEERQKYYGLSKKMPEDIDELLKDIKSLGRRQISGLLRWRGKIKEFEHKQKMKQAKEMKKQEKQSSQQYGDHYDEDQEQNEQNEVANEVQQNSQDELESKILSKRKKELKDIRNKQEKRNQLLIKAQAANTQLHEDQQMGEAERFQNILDENEDIEDIDYVEPDREDDIKVKGSKKQFANYSAEELERNLEQMYELKQQKKQQKIQHAKDVQRQKKQRREERASNVENKLKSRRFGVSYEDQQEEKQNRQKQPEKKVDHDFEGYKFKNPLAALDDEDIYISENEEQIVDDEKVDPNQKMDGEVSDDDAYKIPKPLTDMQKRRKRIKKTAQKKQRKLHNDIEEGEDVGGRIEIVKHKTMDDYNIDELAQTLVIAKKMLRNHSRQQIIDESYRGLSFEDHDDLPKWFTDDEKRHNFKNLPITKEEFKQEKDRLMAINARVPKKILEAKVRRKIRVQKKLKQTQKKAEHVMSQQGITQVSKLRQVGKLYDKSKRHLKDNKKYVIGKRSKAIGGKDSRKVKHVDSRLKKDKRAEKRISKTRQVKRRHKKRGKF